ncbi:MAG TPA: transglycosylase family protein [Thermoleophilaceae bacterium]
MRRALAVALTTLAAPATALAAKPFNDEDLAPSPLLDKALMAHQTAKKARAADAKRDPVAIPAHLAAIAACESGGNPRAIGGGGQYRGLFQFDVGTWNAVGGQGDPAAASVAEQVKRAEILYSQAGPGQWPVCGA